MPNVVADRSYRGYSGDGSNPYRQRQGPDRITAGQGFASVRVAEFEPTTSSSPTWSTTVRDVVVLLYALVRVLLSVGLVRCAKVPVPRSSHSCLPDQSG